MATITTNAAIDMRSHFDDYIELTLNNIISADESEIRLQAPDGRVLIATGTFEYDVFGDLEAGVFTGFEVRSASGATAAEADDFVLYDTATGNLYYDPDGNGEGNAVQFAQLDTDLTLTADDFVVILAASVMPVSGYRSTTRRPRRHSIVAGLALLAVAFGTAPRGQVVLDGTLGPAGALSGPDFVLSRDLGQTRGANLFYSFESFSIAFGESATFRGPAAIDHVIARVTGGTPSEIDGLLRSTIPSADLWFINPAGLLFGENAELDVDGSFHASTANYVRLGSDGRFDATAPGNSTLTSAPPVAFGFLAAPAAALEVNGSVLWVGSEHELSLIGGDTTISGAELGAVSGAINLAAAGVAGEVVLDGPGLHASAMEDFAKIEITASELVTQSANGISTGGVYILGGSLLVDSSVISEQSSSAADSGGVHANVTGVMSVNDSLIYSFGTGTGKSGSLAIVAGSFEMTNGTQLSIYNFGTGGSGDLSIVTSDTVAIDGVDSIIDTSTGSGAAGNISIVTPVLNITAALVASNTFGTADAGNVSFDVDMFNAADGASVATDAYGSGAAGDLQITASVSTTITGETTWLSSDSVSPSSGGAGSISISTPELIVDRGMISVDNHGAGVSGDIEMRVARLQLLNGGEITASTYFESGGGSIDITATESIEVSGAGSDGIASEISSSTFFATGSGGAISIDSPRVQLDGGEIAVRSLDGGRAGDVSINVDDLIIENGAKVNSSTLSGEDAGSIVIQASRSVSITGSGGGFVSALESTTSGAGAGNGGTIVVATPSLGIDRGEIVSTSSSSSQGDAGRIDLHLGSLSLMNSAQISVATSGAGAGGSIRIDAADIEIRSGGEILASTLAGGDGGNVEIRAGQLILSGDGADKVTGIVAQTEIDSSGNGGALSVTADRLVVRDGAEISAATVGAGNAGELHVVAGELLLARNGAALFTGLATQAGPGSSGNAGSLTVTAGNLELRNGAQISAGTFGPGAGGDLKVAADHILMVGDRSATATLIVASSEPGSSGRAGNIDIAAQSLEVRNGAQITSDTFGSGDGGDLRVQVGSLLLSGDDGRFATALSTNAGSGSSGDAGSIVVHADAVDLNGFAGISAITEGVGDGGDIRIVSDVVRLSDGGYVLASSNGAGRAGNIVIRAGTRFESFDGIVSTETQFSDGGDITINAQEMVLLVDSSITTSVGGGEGAGGNIFIDPQFVILIDSDIITNARDGPGGDITIVADNFLASADSVVNASSDTSIDGTVTIDSPETDVSGSLVVLPENYLDATALLAQRCGAQTGQRSSLVANAGRALPPEPGGYLTAVGVGAESTGVGTSAQIPEFRLACR